MPPFLPILPDFAICCTACCRGCRSCRFSEISADSADFRDVLPLPCPLDSTENADAALSRVEKAASRLGLTAVLLAVYHAGAARGQASNELPNMNVSGPGAGRRVGRRGIFGDPCGGEGSTWFQASRLSRLVRRGPC
jgi:hypothetical protein